MPSTKLLIPRNSGPFKGLDILSRAAFGLIFDRWKLSRRDKNAQRFTDERGYIFCVFDREEMAAELCVSLPTLRAAITRLVKAGVLVQSRDSIGATYRYRIPYSAWFHLEPKAEAELFSDLDDIDQ